MKKREFCQLSQIWDGQHISGWYESSKLDGFRCIWDGGVSRGVMKDQVPWANTAKDERYRTPPVATGLWSRYGNVINAPDWFLNGLPRGIILDGELWAEHLSRQHIRSICSPIMPGDGWLEVGYHVWTQISPEIWLTPGVINNPNFVSKWIGTDALPWFYTNGGYESKPNTFEAIYKSLQKRDWSSHLRLVEQRQLPWLINRARNVIAERLIEEVARPRGEGLILTNPEVVVSMTRTQNSLKVKPRDDSEGIVIGYKSAQRGKIEGMLGALIVQWEGKVFELSGFTDEERRLSESSWAYAYPGEELPEDVWCLAFPRGTQVGFTYRGLTDDGIPNEGVYKREKHIFRMC